MLEALVELLAGWLQRRRARRERTLPGPGGPRRRPGEEDASPEASGLRQANRLPPGAATIRDYHGEDGQFLSAESQREALLASVQQTTSTRGGRARRVRQGMQVSRKGGGTAVPFVEWDSRWPRPYLCDGEPFDRAEMWAAAVEAEAPEVVEQNRARASQRVVTRSTTGGGT